MAAMAAGSSFIMRKISLSIEHFWTDENFLCLVCRQAWPSSFASGRIKSENWVTAKNTHICFSEVKCCSSSSNFYLFFLPLTLDHKYLSVLVWNNVEAFVMWADCPENQAGRVLTAKWVQESRKWQVNGEKQTLALDMSFLAEAEWCEHRHVCASFVWLCASYRPNWNNLCNVFSCVVTCLWHPHTADRDCKQGF